MPLNKQILNLIPIVTENHQSKGKLINHTGKLIQTPRPAKHNLDSPMKKLLTTIYSSMWFSICDLGKVHWVHRAMRNIELFNFSIMLSDKAVLSLLLSVVIVIVSRAFCPSLVHVSHREGSCIAHPHQFVRCWPGSRWVQSSPPWCGYRGGRSCARASPAETGRQRSAVPGQPHSSWCHLEGGSSWRVVRCVILFLKSRKTTW